MSIFCQKKGAATVNANLTLNERIESDPVFSVEASDYGEGWWGGWLAVTLARERISHCEREFVLIDQKTCELF
jgi:hypothetical protein